MSRVARLEQALARPAAGVFDERELDGLPDPVARYFRASIQPGTPLALTARLTVCGRIRLRSWMRFRGSEVIAPGLGFVWAVRAGPVSGYDRYVQGEGEMRWKLLGLLPVMRADGPDISRSAAARAAGEGIWLPTALLPRFGVRWDASDDDHIVSHHTLGGYELTCRHTLDERAHIVHTCFERWGDPDGTGSFALHSFGVEHTAHTSFGGIAIPSAGRAGWHHGSERWPEGIFFEYGIEALQPAP